MDEVLANQADPPNCKEDDDPQFLQRYIHVLDSEWSGIFRRVAEQPEQTLAELVRLPGRKIDRTDLARFQKVLKESKLGRPVRLEQAVE